MDGWEPKIEEIEKVIGILEQTRSGDNSIQQRLNEQLLIFSSNPEFTCYLMVVFSQLKDQDVVTRISAGLMAKNNIAKHFGAFSVLVKAFIMESAIASLNDCVRQIRQTASAIISKMVFMDNFECWDLVLSRLFSLIDSSSSGGSSDVNGCIGAFNTLRCISEDTDGAFSVSGSRVKDVRPMLERCAKFIEYNDVLVQECVLSLLLNLVQTNPIEVEQCTQEIIGIILRMADSPVVNIRLLVIKLLYTFTETSSPNIYGIMNPLLNTVFKHTTDSDDAIVLECCEFWIVFANMPHGLEYMSQQMLNELVAILLEKMKYAEDDSALENLNADTNDPDKPEDLKPFVGRRSARGADLQQSEDNDDEGGHGESSASWNVRKCAAAALDQLSGMFASMLFNSLLPVVQRMLNDRSNWISREAAILALGAVSLGCLDSIAPHLPSLVPLLVQFADDQISLVRSITCWTIGRYASWIVRDNNFLDQAFPKILIRIVDNNKKVQEAACSAFATFEEEISPTALARYIEPALKSFEKAFAIYQTKNLYLLYEAIGGFADVLGPHLRHRQVAELLMRPLLLKYNSIDNSDLMILSVMECFGFVAVALGDLFVPYVGHITHRTVLVIRANLDSGADCESIVIPVVLISSMCDGLTSKNAELSLKNALDAADIVSLLPRLMNSEHPEVKQCTLALFGDLAKHVFPLILPCLDGIIRLSTLAMTTQRKYVAICNNATWAVGEIVKQIGLRQPHDDAVRSLKNDVGSAVGPIIDIFVTESKSKHVTDNSALTIGNICYLWPELISPVLDPIMEHLCDALAGIKDENEKSIALKGLINAVRINHSVISSHMTHFCRAVLSTQNHETRSMLIILLREIQQTADPGTWSRAINGLEFNVKKQVEAIFSNQAKLTA